MNSRSCGCCELTPEERRRRLQLPEGYDSVPLCNIDILLQSVTDAMNAIPVTDDFDLVKATRLFYTVMCLKNQHLSCHADSGHSIGLPITHQRYLFDINRIYFFIKKLITMVHKKN